MTIFVKRGRHPADPTGELYGDTHNPLPNYYDREPVMNIAINRETMTFVGAGEYRVLWAKAVAEAPADTIVIGEASSLRTYSKFTDLELKMLYRNTTGFPHEGINYNALLQSCKELGLQLEPLPTPVGLVRDIPKQAPLSPRKTPSTSGSGDAPTLPPAPCPRPKSGTATGRVWEVADEVLEALSGQDQKAQRAEVLRRCTEEGINPATVQVQYGKWRGSKNSTIDLTLTPV